MSERIEQARLERQIAAIWADYLERERVEPEQSFTELGGHSLQAAELVQEIAQEIALPLVRSSLLGLGTVRAQAELLAAMAPAELVGGR